MLVKNGDIWVVAGVKGEDNKTILQGVLALPADKLTVRGKYFMAKLGRKLTEPLADIEAARVKLVQQYGTKTDSGYTVAPGEPLVAFQTGFAEIMDIETEMDWPLVTLTDKDAEALTVGEMLALDLFITFPEPKEPQGTPSDGVVKEAEAVLNKK